MLFSERSSRYVEALSAVSDLFEAGPRFRRQGKSPIDLSIGNPFEKPPQEYFERLGEFLTESAQSDSNLHGYTPMGGLPEARAKIAEDLAPVLQTELTPAHVFLTAGATNAIDVILATFINPGDEIILLAPYFIEYPNLADIHQAKAVVAETDPALNIPAIETAISKKTKLLILNSPNNPTGAVYGETELQALADMLERKNQELGTRILVVEDASYNTILFGGLTQPSIMSRYAHTIFVSSFSKSIGIAGERMGYLAVSPRIADEDESKHILMALTVYIRMRVVHAPALQQRVVGGLGLNTRVDASTYEKKAQVLGDALAEAGFTFRRPDGGFYIFAELPDSYKDEAEFRKAAHSGDDPLLYVPGAAFGGARYGRYVRFSYCVSMENVERGCRKIARIFESKE